MSESSPETVILSQKPVKPSGQDKGSMWSPAKCILVLTHGICPQILCLAVARSGSENTFSTLFQHLLMVWSHGKKALSNDSGIASSAYAEFLSQISNWIHQVLSWRIIDQQGRRTPLEMKCLKSLFLLHLARMPLPVCKFFTNPIVWVSAVPTSSATISQDLFVRCPQGSTDFY